MDTSYPVFRPNSLILSALLIIFMALSPRPASAEDSILQQVRKNAGRIKTLQASFVQEKQMKILVKPLVSKGRFFFRAPGTIRWEYQTPVKSLILLHRGEVKRFFEKDGHMVPDTAAGLQAMQIVMGHITDWLGGRFDESPDFRIVPGRDRIVLIPPESISGMIQRIELVLSENPGIIDRIIIHEDENNYTRISFQDLKIDQPIEETVFQLLP